MSHEGMAGLQQNGKFSRLENTWRYRMIDVVLPTLMKIDTTSLNYSLCQLFASLHVNKVVIIDN